MKRLLAVILLICIAVPLAACGGNGNAPETTTAATPSDTTAAPEDTKPAETTIFPEMPENPDYDGYEFVTLFCSGGGNNFNDFVSDNPDYEIVNEAIYRRNEKLCEFFNAKMTNIEDIASSFGGGPGFQRIKSDYLAAESNYDLATAGNFDMAQLAKSKYLEDLHEVPYIDLTQSWWDQRANRDLGVNGKMYFSTGDIGIVDNLATHCMLFSKTIAELKGITDIYDLVYDEKWTLDKLEKYVQDVSDDLNGDDVMNDNDLYGMLCWNDAFQGAFAGAQSYICTLNDEHEIEFTLYSEKNVDLAARITKMFFNPNVSYNYINTVGTARGAEMFANSQGLFMTTIFSTVPKLRETDMDFGIIPYPKYNEEQDGYGTFVGSTYSVMYCIEPFAEDLERCGAFTEMMAYLSKQFVTPAYYDHTLKGRDARDEESQRCLDIIFASRTFDFGVMYAVSSLTGQLTSMMKDGSNRFETIYNSSKRSATTAVNMLNKEFSK